MVVGVRVLQCLVVFAASDRFVASRRLSVCTITNINFFHKCDCFSINFSGDFFFLFWSLGSNSLFFNRRRFFFVGILVVAVLVDKQFVTSTSRVYENCLWYCFVHCYMVRWPVSKNIYVLVFSNKYTNRASVARHCRFEISSASWMYNIYGFHVNENRIIEVSISAKSVVFTIFTFRVCTLRCYRPTKWVRVVELSCFWISILPSRKILGICSKL